jgi:hypothetical protein
LKRAAALIGFLLLVGSAGAAGEGSSAGPTFARARAYPTGHLGIAAMAVGDLNGDDKPDLVSGSSRTTVSVLVNKGDGRFRAKREFGTGRDPKAVAIGDLDGDGSGDIATMNAGTVSVLLNNGDGTFRAKRDYATARNSSSMVLGDVNGDAKLDVVTANFSDVAAISLFLNVGDGSFHARRDFVPGLSAEVLAMGDVNDDGSPDLAVGGETQDGLPVLSVFLNASDGSFPTRHDDQLGVAPNSIEIGDVNGDGKPDLIWTHSEKETGPLVFVQLNRGRGRFFEGRRYAVHGDWATGGTSVAIGDLNGDRKADLAVTSRLHAVSVLVNRGAGAFRRQLDYGTGKYTVFVVLAADLNGDRKLDLVVNSGTVQVLLNRPGLCDVQDLRRLTLLEAKRTLARVNCRVGKVGYAYSRTIRGLVIRQKPKLGAVLPRGAKVDVVLSRGGQPR